MDPIRSIGIIMDGNRRWATAKNLPRVEGHRAGYTALKAIAEAAPRLKETYGLTHAVFYGFSTENWNREKTEVAHLMDLFAEWFRWVVNEYVKQNARNPERATRLRVIGERERFSPALQNLMEEAEKSTAAFGGITVVLALSYGGRAEILQAIEKLKNDTRPVSEEVFESALWTAGVPDPDLIIRTGGEQRLSNFLTWQSVYSEFFFTKTLWPDFTVGELEKIFAEFELRKRNHGT